jgi:NAD(P)-dependent dehydrogenase (short-subunit alcohol dehydrogenase family)
MRFKDEAILVTGGAMGIGAATVRRLAQEGATVIVADHDREAGEKTVASVVKEAGSAVFQFVDLADGGSIVRMGREVAERFDSLHGLVNNAGIIRRGTLDNNSEDDWHPQIDINLRAPVRCARELLPLLAKGPGHIVNVSSEGAFRPRPEHWVYDVTKSGICSVTRTMALEFRKHGIRVNTVAPGWCVTEMHFRHTDNPETAKKELEDKRYDGAIIQRLGRPEEIAAAIAFLLGDDASYITATTLHVDGGRVAH